MSKIATVIDEGFEDSEFQKPFEAMKEAGHELYNIGLEKGSKIKGKNQEVLTSIDYDFSEAHVSDFDALFIPGGYSPDHLRAHDEPVRFVKEFVLSGKPVFSICHGPQLMITADVLRGRKITGWKSIIQDIKNAGAMFMDEPVVEDQNIISSRSPEDIPAFNERILRKLDELKKSKAA